MTAHTLRREAPDCDIVLIDREREHLFAPSLLWLLIGDRQPAAIKRPLSRLDRKGIRVVTGEIEQIDAQRDDDHDAENGPCEFVLGQSPEKDVFRRQTKHAVWLDYTPRCHKDTKTRRNLEYSPYDSISKGRCIEVQE